jgi:hypothetical protein
MRRILLVLSVAAVMAAMVAVSAMPALAGPKELPCRTILDKAPSDVVFGKLVPGNHPCFQS